MIFLLESNRIETGVETIFFLNFLKNLVANHDLHKLKNFWVSVIIDLIILKKLIMKWR